MIQKNKDPIHIGHLNVKRIAGFACLLTFVLMSLALYPDKVMAELGKKELKPEQLGAMFTRACRDTGLKQSDFRDQMAFYGFVEDAEKAYTNDIHSIIFRLVDANNRRYCQMFYSSSAYGAEALTRAIAFSVFDFEGSGKMNERTFSDRFRASDASFKRVLNPFSDQHFLHKKTHDHGDQAWYVAVVSQPADLGNSLDRLMKQKNQ